MPLTDIYKEKFTSCLEKTKETGYVEEVKHPVVYINGLPKAKLSEVVYFESGCMGVVTSLLEAYVEVMVFRSVPIVVGEQVARSDEILSVPVGEGLLGSVVNSLGNSMYDNKVVTGITEYRNIEATPPSINLRQRITQPLETGVALVDFLIPLCKGQRELVIGD